MVFQSSVIDIIKRRTSVRTYDERSIDEEAFQKLNDYISQISNDANVNVRFIIVENELNGNKVKEAGTYGIISGAHTYIICILDKDDNNALELGYLFEKIVLFATDLGISTCWMGGTFKKDDFEQFVSLKDNEFMPIISPIGYKKDKSRIFETAMRKSISADKRKPWSELFFNKNLMPLDEKDAAQFKLPLEMVRLGPSASNKQPWRIIKEDDMFHFFICRTKGYGVAGYDLQKNDLGIARCHFDMTVQELGIKGNWQKIELPKAINDWEYVVTFKIL